MKILRNACIVLLVLCLIPIHKSQAKEIQPGDPTENSNSNIYSSMLEEYYELSSSYEYGYATRYGDNNTAIVELYNSILRMMHQEKYGFPLIGGNYGLHDGMYIRNDTDLSIWLSYNKKPNYITLTKAQRNLHTLSEYNIYRLREYITSEFVGVISMKSPNDIGRIFCLYNYRTAELVGKVIVGGTAKLNDWTYINHTTDDIPLAYRMQGNLHWKADIPNIIFYKLLYDDKVTIILKETNINSICMNN